MTKHDAAATIAGKSAVHAEADRTRNETLVNEQIDAWHGVRAAIRKATRAAGNAVETSGKPSPARRRGPGAHTFERAMAAMLHDLQAGRVTSVELEQEKQEVLKLEYGVRGTSTVREARDAALAEFKRRQTPTVDN
jgi:hypothetical protein